MVDLAGSVTVTVELEHSRIALMAVSRQLSGAASAAPRRDASGWDGLAAWAYQRSLDLLFRDLEAAQALLRSATDLTTAALFEAGGHV